MSYLKRVTARKMCNVKNMGHGKKSLPDLENCVTVRKMGNPKKDVSLYCVISLANFRLLLNLLLFRSSTARISGTIISSRWSLHKENLRSKEKLRKMGQK